MAILLQSFSYAEILLAILLFLFLRRLTVIGAAGPLWNFPVIGMLPGLLIRIPKIHDEVAELLARSGWTFAFRGPWLGGMNLLFTSDPANVHHVMSKNFPNFPKGHEFAKMFDALGDGIFNADGDSWKAQRAAARTVLNHHRFRRFAAEATKDKVQNRLVPLLDRASEKGLILDLQDVFQRFTFDLTCKLLTGFDPESLSVTMPEVPFSKAMDNVMRTIFLRHLASKWWWTLLRFLNLGPEKRLRKAQDTLDDFVAKHVRMKREALLRKSSKEQERVDLLTAYIDQDELETKVSDHLNVDDKLLRDTIVNLMLAGRDTTASALAWFFWLLSRNPTATSKIREELHKKSAKNDNGGLHENEMVYLHGALCEALRLYPPVPYEHKEPVRPDVLPTGHCVDPTTKVLFSLYAMGRMASLWGEDCLEFKPERWVSDRGGLKHEPSYKFLAFNAGPRTCLGKEVAFTQMKAAATAIVDRFDVEVVEGHPVTAGLSLILHMKHGLKVRVFKRS